MNEERDKGANLVARAFQTYIDIIVSPCIVEELSHLGWHLTMPK